jgi:lysophospholipase L1-like esterase
MTRQHLQKSFYLGYMFRRLLVCTLLVLISGILPAQQLRSWVPERSDQIHGKGWLNEPGALYSRLPDRLRPLVTNAVWDLSTNGAGLMVLFHTNAPTITVKYTVTGGHSFPHMPATGVSGVDLYGKDRDGNWIWFPGRYSFHDTISYTFSRLLSIGDTSKRKYEYRLYLPLYNSVKYLEFSYPDSFACTPASQRQEKPIVVYGTSIAQGGCASRPGLAWTSILERSMDRPLLNLGFSGNGRLDSAVIDLIAEVDAKVFILDCLPNLVDAEMYPDEEVAKRLSYAVQTLHAKRPHVPIVLSEHSAGSATSAINLEPDNRYLQVNSVLNNVVDSMKQTGIKNIFVLTNSDIGFRSDATVDGVHPADIGMAQNAKAYERLLRDVLNEPSDTLSTTIPVSQSRDAFYFMPSRHQEVISLNRALKPETVFIGNSIVHMWGGKPESSIVNGKNSWNNLFDSTKSVNMGFGWDRVENVLWRVYHDELDGFTAKRIFVMIGTNNIGLNTDDEITRGLAQLYSAIRSRQSQAKLFIIGILPRRNEEKRINRLNERIAALAGRFEARFFNPGKRLLKKDGKIDEGLFTDGLHPNEAGYSKLANEIKNID